MRAHEFDGERCIHCGVNIYDCDHTDSECCVWRKPTVHTSETAPQDRHLAPEKRAALRAFADGLPAKHIDWASLTDSALGLEHDGDEEPVQHGNRGLGGYQCTCGRFAKFLRWQATGAPGYERGYLVNCKRCGEVLVF